jgi:hypothetical protein
VDEVHVILYVSDDMTVPNFVEEGSITLSLHDDLR